MLVLLFLLWWKHFTQSTPLQISKITILLIIGRGSYSRLPELTLHNWNLYVLTTTTQLFLPPDPGNHYSTLCFSDLDYFRFLILIRLCGICLPVTCFFQHNIFQIQSCCWKWQDFLPCQAEWHSTVHLYHIVKTHSSIHDHLGCFHTLAIMNIAAMNVKVQISAQYQDFWFLWIYFQKWYGNIFDFFKGIFVLFS